MFIRRVAHTVEMLGQLEELLRVDVMPKAILEKTFLATADVQTQRTYALCLAIPSGMLMHAGTDFAQIT